MIDALKAFLEEKGYTDISLDGMPTEAAAPEAIGLFCWSHTAADISDGSGTFLIQIQVRRKTRQAAKTICDELFVLLDSGLDEEPIRLTEEQDRILRCIARPRRGAIILDRTALTTTYYCEIALWGENQ